MIMTLQLFQHILGYFNGNIGRKSSDNKDMYKSAIITEGLFEFETLSFFATIFA